MTEVKLDMALILKIVGGLVILLGSNAGSLTFGEKVVAAPAIQRQRDSANDYADMWNAVVETNRSLVKSIEQLHDDLRLCYRENSGDG